MLEILNDQTALDFAFSRSPRLPGIRRGIRRHHRLETRHRMISHRRCLSRLSDLFKQAIQGFKIALEMTMSALMLPLGWTGLLTSVPVLALEV